MHILTMVVLWLCSVAHPRQRMTVDGHAHHLRLEQSSAWFKGLLQDAGVPCSWTTTHVLHADKFKLQGVLQIDERDVQSWNGSLTSWSREGMPLHDYYHNPLDSFIVRAKSVFKLDDARPVYTKRDNRMRESQLSGADGIFQPSGLDFNVLAALPGFERLVHDAFGRAPSRATLSEVLQRWGVPPDGFDGIAACLLPEPISELVLQGRWQDLLWIGRWGWFKSPLCKQGMWEGFRVPPAVQAAKGQHEVLRSEPLDLLEVEGFLQNLRRWSPVVLSQCNSEEERAGEQMHLEAFATWLRQLLLYFRPYFAKEAADLQAKRRPDLSGHQRYSHSQLLGMVLFAWHLRDSVALTDVMPSALQAIMPDFFALTSVAKGVQVLKQSKSLLRNAQLGVDIALMLVRCRQLQASGPSARYGWADSSAVAKSDWLISKHQAVPESRCPELWQSWSELVHSTDVDNDNEREGLDAAVASRRKALTQELMAEVRVHTQPPQALALGLTAIESKLAALLYSFFLEVGSMKGLRDFLSTFVSFTTDMGTEMGTASFILDDLQKLLPEWLADPLLLPDVDGGGEDENSGAFEGLSLFMPRAIIIPGALHICSNLCKDVSGKLSHWSLFLKQLALFEALLCNRDRRERFLATCVSANSEDRRLFKNFSGSLYEKRWGAVISFLRKLVPLLVAFEKHWNHDKYLHAYHQRDGAGAEADEGVRFVAADLSAALGSSMFHAYIQMVMSLFNVVEDLSSWFEGCACHQAQLKRQKGKHTRSSRKEIELCGPYAFCPMKGKRAPELAAGCLNEVFSKLVNLGKTSLLKVIQVRKLGAEDEVLVMQDFEAGRSYIQLGLQVKMNFWSKLPWRLAALSHTDAAVARAAAADMLETTAGLAGFEGDASLVHHPTTLHFLGNGSLLRPMIQEFANGEAMHDFLRSEACKLAFMPVVERSIEAKHSLISRRVQKNWRSGRIVSLTLRVPDIKAEIAADATYLQTLVEAFAETRDPMRAARQLGIQEHPDLVSAVFDRWHHARVTGIVNRIVYRCDLQSKFESHAAVRAGHDRESGKRARLAQKEMQRIVQASPAPPAGPRTEEERYTSMLRLAIEDHFTQLTSARSQPCVYSLDVSSDPTGSAPALTALDAAFEGQEVVGVARARATDSRLISDVEDAAQEPKLYFEGAEIVHFQVVHASPSNMHTVPMPRAAGTRLTKGQYAVSIHSLVEDGDGFRHIALEPVTQGQTSVAILSGLAAGRLDVLQETFTQFSLGPLSYNIKGFKAQGCSCSAEVSQLVRCCAFPAGDGRCEVPLENGRVPRQWEELEAAGFIECVSENEDNMKDYVFTEAGAAGIQAVVTLVEPKLVCQPRSDLALTDLSVYELIKKLEDSGWTWSCLPTKTQQKKELCYSADSDKTWYFGSGLPSPLYLQCLLRAEELRNLGVVSIPHYSSTPSTTYKRLLQGEAVVTGPVRPPARLALLDDVDEGRGSLEPLELQPPSDFVFDDETSPDGPRIHTMEEIEEALGWFSSPEDSGEEHGRTPRPPLDVESQPPAAGSGDVSLAHPAEPAGPAPARAETAEASARVVRVLQPGSISRWGPFRISRLAPKPPFRKFGALEAVCPFHMRNEKSECKKYIGHKTDNPEDQDLDYKALLHWCNQASAFNRQKHHVGSRLLSHESARGLSMDVLIAHRINDPPTEPPTPDSVLDAPAPKGRAASKAKAKASVEPHPAPDVVVHRRARKKQKQVQDACALPSEPAASTASVEAVEAAPAAAGSSSASSSNSGSGRAASQASGSDSDSDSSNSSSSSGSSSSSS